MAFWNQLGDDAKVLYGNAVGVGKDLAKKGVQEVGRVAGDLKDLGQTAVSKGRNIASDISERAAAFSPVVLGAKLGGAAKDYLSGKGVQPPSVERNGAQTDIAMDQNRSLMDKINFHRGRGVETHGANLYEAGEGALFPAGLRRGGPDVSAGNTRLKKNDLEK